LLPSYWGLSIPQYGQHMSLAWFRVCSAIFLSHWSFCSWNRLCPNYLLHLLRSPYQLWAVTVHWDLHLTGVMSEQTPVSSYLLVPCLCAFEPSHGPIVGYQVRAPTDGCIPWDEITVVGAPCFLVHAGFRRAISVPCKRQGNIHMPRVGSARDWQNSEYRISEPLRGVCLRAYFWTLTRWSGNILPLTMADDVSSRRHTLISITIPEHPLWNLLSFCRSTIAP
jgi:hypothetical protein